MVLAYVSIAAGLVLLTWSAERFVQGAAGTARHLDVPPLLIGMVVVGFGTSAPEMVVSALAATSGNPGLALGNAYGSNITNIALILGLTALMSPIAVQSRILREELPILAAVTALAAWQLRDGRVTRPEAAILLAVFGTIMAWTIWRGLRVGRDAFAEEVERELGAGPPLPRSVAWLVAGLALLVASSRLLVWGAVEVARAWGVSDLVVGLTVVAIGTSLPELAASVAAARKGENDLALGNVLGSNLFNTLAVVGIAGAILPMSVGPEVFSRDVATTALFTLLLFAFGYRRRAAGRINRVEGAALLAGYVAYTGYLVATAGPL
jgi:cation:H+ antiporter